MKNKQVNDVKVESYEYHPYPDRPNVVDRFGIGLILENRVTIELTPIQAMILLDELAKSVSGMKHRFGIL